MITGTLLPTLPLHDDELTQGYFARIGYFHAGVDVGRFCRYIGMSTAKFRDGTLEFLEVAAALSGIDPVCLGNNQLRRVSDDHFVLRGEPLARPLLRRTTVRFCPECLAEDHAADPGTGFNMGRLRWSWLLRPVVSCPVHQTVLIECSEPDGVKAFDLPKLLARNESAIRSMEPAARCPPGRLQSYLISRLAGARDVETWLDGQTVAQAVNACQMLGSLVADGPSAEIISYTELDWARVGDVGFGICVQGAGAITASLTEIRQTSGRRSGRTGPQAVFGKLYRWLEYGDRAGEAGPIRNLVREAILNSFAIGPGNTVLGEAVDHRRVHSVNSLKAATGLHPLRLYRLMTKAGLIPADTDDEALNQWVFPAEEGERLIGRVLNSIPQNQIKTFLGCSRTQAEQLAASELVTSVVPIAEGSIGLSVGAYNRDELSAFLTSVCRDVPVVGEAPTNFVNLTIAARGRSSTAEILRWQIEGRLRKTRCVGKAPRIDGLRFCLDEIRTLLRAQSRLDFHPLRAVAVLLGVNIKVVKRLISTEEGEPLLALVPPDACRGLRGRGRAYVSSNEIERFKAVYMTLARAAEAIGIHPLSARTLLEDVLTPIRDPAILGVRLYRSEDVKQFVSQIGARSVDDLRKKGLRKAQAERRR